MGAGQVARSSRRSFLGAAATGGALLAASAVPGAAEAGKRKKSKKKSRAYSEKNRVDVHAHYLAPAYLAALKASGIGLIGGIPIPQWSPQRALRFMDLHGIQIQMLSVSDPGVNFVAPGQAGQLARECNDYVAGVVRQHPKRFGAFAVLPVQEADQGRAEAINALDKLEMEGVGLLSSYEGRYLGDPLFEGLMSDLNRRSAWVFVHPTAVADTDRPAYSIPNFIAEYPFDTTRTIISLLFNRTFERYPKIRWHFAHGGGTIPMLRPRLSALAGNAKQFGALLGLPKPATGLTAKSPERALKKSFYDTALIADAPGLEAVQALAGGKKILFGSDWPFAERLYNDKKFDPTPALSKTFSASKRRGIDRLNARAEFKRAARATPGR